MKRGNSSLKTGMIGLFVVAAVAAGCNSAAGPPSSGSSLTGGNSPSGVRRADTETTTYKVVLNGHGFGNLHGTYTPEPCWTVSPSPLPKYVTTDKVWVTYSDGCSTRSITITYESGYNSDIWPCYYKIHYPAGGPFQYSTQPEYGENCAVATAPPSKNYDEQLIYGIINAPHSPRRR